MSLVEKSIDGRNFVVASDSKKTVTIHSSDTVLLIVTVFLKQTLLILNNCIGHGDG